jgi:hypothetical protein
MRRGTWLVISIGAATVCAYAAAAANVRTIPLCQPTNLRASASLQGATQSMLGRLWVKNTLVSACRLPNRPMLRLMTGPRALEGRELPWTEWSSLGIDHSHLRVLAPGTTAFVIVQWRGCPRWAPSPGGYFRAVLQISFPGGTGQLNVPLSAPITVPCDSLGEPSTLSVSYFIEQP